MKEEHEQETRKESKKLPHHPGNRSALSLDRAEERVVETERPGLSKQDPSEIPYPA